MKSKSFTTYRVTLYFVDDMKLNSVVKINAIYAKLRKFRTRLLGRRPLREPWGQILGERALVPLGFPEVGTYSQNMIEPQLVAIQEVKVI